MQQILSFQSTPVDLNSDTPIYIVNCGYYKNVARPISVDRPVGRLDYQLLLPVSGEMMIDKKRVTPGEIFLYHPGFPQSYTYFEGEGTEYYWIHFYGSKVASTCASLALENGVYELLDSKKDTERLVRMIIKSFSDHYAHADEYSAGLLSSILALISAPPIVSSPFNKAMKLLRDPSCTLSISDLAKMYEMSEGHFIRSFKQYTGQSPNSFRITNKLEIASDMLTSTKMSVSDIAAAVGFADPLYFSRIFKKNFGLSPCEHRKNRSTER